MLMNVGQVVLGRGRHVQRPYYAGWEGALPRGPLPSGGWRGLQPAKTRVTFSRGPDVMAGAGTWHPPARMSHWEGALPTLRSGPVGSLAFFS